MPDNFNIKTWSYKQRLREFEENNNDANISPQDSFKIWNWLKNYLESPSKKSGLRMSIFQQEFPTATSFYFGLQNHGLGSLTESGYKSIEKIDINYTDRGRFYKTILVKGGETIKIGGDDTNSLLNYLGINLKLPKISDFNGISLLNDIVDKLTSLEIEATWDDSMDVS